MSSCTPQQAVSLASALIQLRSEALTSISKATGIRAPNLSVWLRGKSQVISEPRIVKLLYHLGIRGAELRKDIVHSWLLRGGLENLTTVLAALVAAPKKIYEDVYRRDRGIHAAAILIPHSEGGHIAVRLAAEPGLGQSPHVVTEAFGFPQRVVDPLRAFQFAR